MLDGELIVPGPEGKPDFEKIMSRIRSKISNIPIQIVVFDVIYGKYDSLINQPLLLRKEWIVKNISIQNHLVISNFFRGQALAFFELVKEKDLEGIVIKKENSLYKLNHRSKD